MCKENIFLRLKKIFFLNKPKFKIVIKRLNYSVAHLCKQNIDSFLNVNIKQTKLLKKKKKLKSKTMWLIIIFFFSQNRSKSPTLYIYTTFYTHIHKHTITKQIYHFPSPPPFLHIFLSMKVFSHLKISPHFIIKRLMNIFRLGCWLERFKCEFTLSYSSEIHSHL